jgi:hypothetical protein
MIALMIPIRTEHASIWRTPDSRIVFYNSSVPLPFKVEDTVTTDTTEQSRTVERNFHSIIDTLNPDLRKNIEASRREFFRMTPEEGKSIFSLVTTIMSVSPAGNRISY